MAEANISVMALPATDLHLGARGDRTMFDVRLRQSVNTRWWRECLYCYE